MIDRRRTAARQGSEAARPPPWPRVADGRRTGPEGRSALEKVEIERLQSDHSSHGQIVVKHVAAPWADRALGGPLINGLQCVGQFGNSVDTADREFSALQKESPHAHHHAHRAYGQPKYQRGRTWCNCVLCSRNTEEKRV
jgi:hypothetical protein